MEHLSISQMWFITTKPTAIFFKTLLPTSVCVYVFVCVGVCVCVVHYVISSDSYRLASSHQAFADSSVLS